MIPARIIARLHDAGVRDLNDWRKLTRRQRHGIFGVPLPTVELLDQLAKARRP